MIYQLGENGITVEDCLIEEDLTVVKQKKGTKLSANNMVAKHKSYMENLADKLRQTNVPEVPLVDRYEECRAVTIARNISKNVNDEAENALKYFQERTRFWELCK